MTDKPPLARRAAALRAINRLGTALPTLALGSLPARPFRVADTVTGAEPPAGNRKNRRSRKS